MLALGTGYRHDVGTLWLPVLFVILWPHRWARAAAALAVFTVLNLTWIGLMLHEAGGWASYRKSTAEFAHQAGYLNSVWNLGLVDASVRYARQADDGPALDVRPRPGVRPPRAGWPGGSGGSERAAWPGSWP